MKKYEFLSDGNADTKHANYRAAKIILVNQKSKILLQLRDNIESIPFPGYWDLWGGRIEPKERDYEAIIRELNEEIPNYQPSQISRLGTILISEKESGVNERVEIAVFTGKIDLPVKKIRLNEGQRAKYFRVEELERIKINHHYTEFINANQGRLKL